MLSVVSLQSISIVVSYFTSPVKNLLSFTSTESTSRSTLSTQSRSAKFCLGSGEEERFDGFVILHFEFLNEEYSLVKSAVVWLSLVLLRKSSFGRRFAVNRRQRCWFQPVPTCVRSCWFPRSTTRGIIAKRWNLLRVLRYFNTWWCNSHAKFCVDVTCSQSQSSYPWTVMSLWTNQSLLNKLSEVVNDNRINY